MNGMFPITSAIENKKGQCYKPRPRFYNNSGNGSAKSQRDEGGSVAA
jgi:hypothetical protein